MKISALIIGILLPAFSFAQESLPASSPASAPTSAPAVMESAPPTPALGLYDKSSERAYKISLYSTVAGVAGTFAFSSLGLFALRRLPENGLGAVSVSRAMFGVSGLFGTLTLFGPSMGHFYAGEVDRGTKLLLRRFFIPTTLFIGGVVTSAVSLSVIGNRLFNEQPVGAGPIIGAGVGFLMVPTGGILYWVMSGKHIVDARSAPSREASRRGLQLAGKSSFSPVPFYDAGTKSLGMGATLKLNF
jgi:hypothetical protein